MTKRCRIPGLRWWQRWSHKYDRRSAKSEARRYGDHW